MLDVHQLNVFLVAAEALSFTQAAKRLHMTQPSVSQHIQSLESLFGMQLFIRSGRNLILTDGGLALVPLAREAVALSQRIEETMESLKGQIHGHLVIGCSTTPGKYIFPRSWQSFIISTRLYGLLAWYPHKQRRSKIGGRGSSLCSV
jgi:DNA-binding transcriptional LysR family regulator